MAEEGTGKAPQMPAHGMFCWSEFAVTDVEKCKAFYETVFGWKFTKSTSTGDEMEYLEFSSFGGDQSDSALYQMKPELFGGKVPPAHIAQYVAVDDIDQSIEKAKSLGGTVVFGPYDIPNVGRMAVVSDPTGAAISLITLAAP